MRVTHVITRLISGGAQENWKFVSRARSGFCGRRAIWPASKQNC
jgi:hypothetical protein